MTLGSTPALTYRAIGAWVVVVSVGMLYGDAGTAGLASWGAWASTVLGASMVLYGGDD